MTVIYRHVVSLFLLLILAALPIGLFNKDEKVSFDIAGIAAVIKEFLMG